MTGYFSRIAKQSGLRFSRGAAKEPRSTIAEPAGKDVLPIAVDETIMIAPSEPGQPAKAKRDKPRSKITAGPQTKVLPAKKVDEADQPDVAADFAEPEQNVETKPELVETKLVPNLPPETESSTHVRTASSLPPEEAVVEPAARKQAMPKDKERSPDPAPEVAERVLVEARKTEDSGEEKITHDVANKDYFIKTAEIIERGDAPAAEIHQILLREVQQWAADSPTESEISEGVVEQTGPQITKRIVSPHLEQTQLIGEPNVGERRETSDLAEQTFELSIGTINVVIEDEKTKQPEPAPRANIQNNTQQPRREFSRLSRHYL